MARFGQTGMYRGKGQKNLADRIERLAERGIVVPQERDTEKGIPIKRTNGSIERYTQKTVANTERQHNLQWNAYNDYVPAITPGREKI